MKINSIILKSSGGFRGLPKGFEIIFNNAFYRNEIDPICLAGLNGSGKSNVLELISEIFFYLEAVHHAQAKKYVAKKNSFGFAIEYETKVTANNLLQSDNTFKVNTLLGSIRKVAIEKLPRQEIQIKFTNDEEWIALDPEHLSYDYNVSQLLPKKIIAYSSGQNELVSNPFLRMDFFYFDEYLKELEEGGDSAEISQNRLFYMDYDSNPFVLLSNFLMRDIDDTGEQKELGILKAMTDVDDVDSFNIVLNLKVKKDHATENLLELIEELKGSDTESLLSMIESELFWDVQLPYQLRRFIEKLERCCTYSDFIYKEEDSEKWLKVTLYFRHIGDNIKMAFQNEFGNGLNLFRQFYLLNLLNIYNYSDAIRDRVKKASSGSEDNISDLIPILPKKDKVFYIDELKLNKKAGNRKELYYKNLSDGEHQFLHIVGSLMLMEEEGTIFLLDEPSTHFNPDWRSKFIHTINEIYKLRRNRFQDPEKAQQLVTLSTHSPFVLSDSKSKNVLWFQKEKGKPVIKELDFETYGASVDYIMKMLSGQNHLIPDRAYKDLRKVIEEGDLREVRAAIEKYGESSEKQFLFKRLYELSENRKNDKTK
ncbi:restriction system-associated AAA family ATPase [Aquimarina muelleri]|uniref:restriction system-associated AAA family ATPase n=1 Tax=Aquimarina muelleri TaxID=279356 RepID=UPI003F683EF0